LKSSLKGTYIHPTEDIHEKMAELLKELPQNDCRRCFEDWKAHVGWCVASDGYYFEGDRFSNLVNKVLF